MSNCWTSSHTGCPISDIMSFRTDRLTSWADAWLLMLPCPPVETTSRSRLAKVTVAPSVRIVPDTRWPGWMRATVNSRVRGRAISGSPAARS